jgi:hypothetical protein
MNSKNTALRRAGRKVLSLGLMLTLALSALEALAGPVRDGPVHHESSVEASSHHLASESGNQGHEHRSVEDHGVHVHGVALIPTVALTFSVSVIDAPMFTDEHHDDLITSAIPHPPRV